MNNLICLFEELINENPNQAIKFLKDKGMDPAIPNGKGENILKKINAITRGDGYTYLLTRFFINSRTQISDLIKLYQYIKFNKDYLARLPQPILNYENYGQLKKDIEKLEEQRTLKRFLNSIGTELAQQVDGMSQVWVRKLINLIKKFYQLTPNHQKHFLKKVFAFKDIKKFVNYLQNYIITIQNKQDYDSIIELIRIIPDTHLVFQDSEREIIIAHIGSFESCKTLGCTANWCIARDISRFREYKAGGNYYFFIWDFEYPINDPNFFIATAYNPEKPNSSKTHEHIDDQSLNLSNVLAQKKLNPNIFINYVSEYKEIQKQSFDATGGLAQALKNENMDGIIEIINSSQLSQEYKIKPEIHKWNDNTIDLNIKKQDMIDMLDLGDEYDSIVSTANSYYQSGGDYDSSESDDMHSGLNADNIEAVKNLARKLGVSPEVYDEFNEKEGQIANFLKKYGMEEIVNDYLSDYVNAEEDAEQREAKSIVDQVPFDVDDSSFNIEKMLEYYIDNQLTAENFDQLIQQIKNKLPNFSYESIYSARYEDLDLDETNRNFKERLEKYELDIDYNEDNEFYNIAKAMRDGTDYLSRIGFNILSDSKNIAEYRDKKNKRTITINELSYEEDIDGNPVLMTTATISDTSKPSSIATKRKIRVPITSLTHYIGQRVIKPFLQEHLKMIGIITELFDSQI